MNVMQKQPVYFEDLGVMEYKAAWDYQESLLQQNVKVKSLAYQNADATDLHEETRHHLLFVEHPHVYTLGKSGSIEHVLINDDARKELGVQFFHTNRGGDITYHGPGQIVGYPILDLEKFETDIGKYLRNIEEVMILTLQQYGIAAGRSKGETGVWIDADVKGKERKICAIGVRSSRWITMHGFALNVNTDLSKFNFIIPCGIQDKQVTSIERELGRRIDMEECKSLVKENFSRVFNVGLLPAPPQN